MGVQEVLKFIYNKTRGTQIHTTQEGERKRKKSKNKTKLTILTRDSHRPLIMSHIVTFNFCGGLNKGFNPIFIVIFGKKKKTYLPI
jgi:hypothetical protein